MLDLTPLVDRWRAFGWDVHDVDGHDARALERTMTGLDTSAGPPHVLLARTNFGYGVDYMPVAGRVALPADGRRSVRLRDGAGRGPVRNAFLDELLSLAAEDERVMLLTGDLGDLHAPARQALGAAWRRHKAGR